LKILETKKNVQEKNKQKHNFIFIKLNQINKIKELQKYKLKLKILFYFNFYQILFVATGSSLRKRRKNCPPFDHLAKCQFASPHTNPLQSLLWQIPFAPLPIFVILL
jgi:hypothetical protein